MPARKFVADFFAVRRGTLTLLRRQLQRDAVVSVPYYASEKRKLQLYIF